jgi:antitoxin ParD1/3/4
MPTATATQEFTITLPKDVAEIVRAKVLSGRYATESEFIEAAIVEAILPSHDDGLEHWIQTEGVRRCEAMDADPSRGLTFEEIKASFEQDDIEEFRTAG